MSADTFFPRRLTDEQADVANEAPGTGVTQVRAYAGTGKTSTLEERSKLRPKTRCVYVCFNKSVQLEAKRRMPPNVTCTTGHSLAFQAVGVHFRHKLADNLHVRSLLRLVEIRRLGVRDDRLAKHILTTLTNYFASPARKIGREHVPIAPKEISPDGEPIEAWRVSAAAIVECAQSVWKRMRDPQDNEVPMLPDGYFKLWSRTNPELQYDEILLDEAQDTSPALASVIAAQTHAHRVLVGDPHQSIYSFRGSRDAMQQMPADRLFRLTQSFRFGEAIAETGSAVLRALNQWIPLRGNPDLSSRREFIAPDSGPYTFLSRTNVGVITHALGAVAAGKKVHFVGGLAKYPFDNLLDVYHLFVDRRADIADYSLRTHYKNFGDYEIYAEEVDDRGAKKLIGLVKEHGAEIPNLVAQVKTASVDAGQRAAVTLSTLHKAKGLEWDRVKLDDDFPSFVDPRTGEVLEAFRNPEGKQEAHMIYIACTRAKGVLDHVACESLNRILETDQLRIDRRAERDALKEAKPAQEVITIGTPPVRKQTALVA